MKSKPVFVVGLVAAVFLIVAAITSQTAYAKQVNTPPFSVALTTKLELTQLKALVQCQYDNYWGDGNYKMDQSDVVEVDLEPNHEGYMAHFPPLSVEVPSFFITKMGCDFQLTGFAGKDPQSGSLIVQNQVYRVTVGSTLKEFDGDVLVKKTRAK